jgi:hypothetical protein
MYNGWAGKIRDVRGNKFYDLLRQNKLPAPKHCHLCNREHGPNSANTYHAEEYGSTWESYLEICKPMCPVCHGMMHMRFKLPNRFKRLKHRVAAGTLLAEAPVIPSLQKFFTIAGKLGDIPFVEDCKSGNPWLDGVQLTAYKGGPKLATILGADGEVPDPIIYGTFGKDWKTLTGVILHSDGTLTEVTYE